MHYKKKYCENHRNGSSDKKIHRKENKALLTRYMGKFRENILSIICNNS